MASGVDGMSARRVVLKASLLTVGTLGFVVCLTMLSESMRSVMDVGGACASGGAYEIRQQCPTGVAWIMPVSIFAGLAFLALGAVGVFSQGGPRPYVFVWSALFLALGWNFLEYGFDAPNGGSAWGWIVCGVVFVVMGGAPLLGLLSPTAARWALWGPPSSSGDGPVTTSPRVRRSILIGPGALRPAVVATPAPPAPAPMRWPAPLDASDATGMPAELVTRLERLAALHERGAIDDDEYDRAKEAVLGDAGHDHTGGDDAGPGGTGPGRTAPGDAGTRS